MKDILYLVMPAYNEEDNIEHVVNAWYPIVEKISEESRLVIADSKSKDATHEILIHLKQQYPQLIVLDNTNQYHGPKVIALYKYAITNRADFIFQTDSDGQTNPEEFRDFWKYRYEYDAIIGYRNERGDGRIRALVEQVVCLLLLIIFGIRIPDANAPFRLMKAELVEKYLDRMPEDYNLPNVLLTTFFVYYKERVRFLKVSFKARQGGVNSVNMARIIKIGWKALGEFIHFKRFM